MYGIELEGRGDFGEWRDAARSLLAACLDAHAEISRSELIAVEGAAPMRPGKWWAALLCLAAAIAFTRWVLAGAPPFGI